MQKPRLTAGLAGEPIHWSLLSRQEDYGVVRSIYQAPSLNFDLTYHVETIDSETLDAEHYRIR